jgi:DNA-directed RNA polymerase subunit RPC12/RpoP
MTNQDNNKNEIKCFNCGSEWALLQTKKNQYLSLLKCPLCIDWIEE